MYKSAYKYTYKNVIDMFTKTHFIIIVTLDITFLKNLNSFPICVMAHRMKHAGLTLWKIGNNYKIIHFITF